ncbi:metallophosphoesterase family protein [Paenibacillus methanolicus]|uniref:Calcineurin-like phosphoesterase family protein n=1 Tax=Paenibacillus methanolicus TaxID=582686 RepID=A0A5S5CJ56_9BACL|nr:metallophosphoesterase family protein [Paenibacillus methanolicus]TYP79819.1 calcineurin-like phosphoesterase family protein [Paenibacillus methanolicus]
MEKQLRFREDGTFTIVQFTDLHWKNGDEEDRRTRSLMELAIEAEAPDLIVFTGDVIYSSECVKPLLAIREAVAAAEASGIPWAVVLGNHDSEAGVTREELHRSLLGYGGSVTGHTPGLTGFGNYAIAVHGSVAAAAAAVLYFLDSGDYSRHAHVDGYAWIAKDQIDWYANRSRSFAAASGGEPLPALAFFHIPLPEYAEAWEQGACRGSKHEAVCSPKLNSGLFAAMVEAGDVMGTFVGHDHINDFTGELCGIRLTYGRASGYNTYGKEGFPRGARVIRLREGDRSFESWLRLDDGRVDWQNEEALVNKEE